LTGRLITGALVRRCWSVPAPWPVNWPNASTGHARGPRWPPIPVVA